MSGCRKRRRGSGSSEAGLVVDDEVQNEDVVDTGVLDTISQQYESLDYDTNYNSVLLDEIRIRGYKFIMQKVFYRKRSVLIFNTFIYLRISRGGLSCSPWVS